MNRCFAFLVALLVANGIACPAAGRSPYRLDRSVDGWIVGGNAALAVASSIAGHSLRPLTTREIDELSRESINRFDRSATYKYSKEISSASYVVAGVAMASPLALFLDAGVRDDWKTCMAMYAETVTLAIFLPALAKNGVKRTRPFVYNPDAPLDEKLTTNARGSFFSRHATMAFASAVFLSTVYDDYYPRSKSKSCVLAGALFAAASVGVMRYESGEHFPSDIITGAVVGSAIGYAVPRLHRASNERVGMMPYWTGPQYGVALRFRI